MSIVNSQIYYINSQYRTTGSNSKFSYEVKIPQTEKYDRVCVLQASIPLSFYLVRNGINTFTLTQLGVDTVITVPEGNYNFKSFMALLVSLF